MRTLRILFVALAVLLVGSKAHAGRIYGWAEAAKLTSSSSGCTLTDNQGVRSGGNYAYRTMNCTDGANREFVLPLWIPPDAPNTGWTARVHYETTDTSASKVCAWNVSIGAYKDGASPLGSQGSTTAIAGSSRTHVAGTRYITSPSATFSLYDVLAAGACASTNCLQKTAKAYVTLDSSATTATGCDFRMLEVRY